MMMEALFDRLNTGVAQSPLLWRMPGRGAYVVNHSYPYSSNGYAVRTHGVASALVAQGCSVLAINRPGHPWDLPGFKDTDFRAHHEIDGVRYLSMRTPSAVGRPLPEYLAAAADALQEVFRLFKPSVVMAASNWENALPAGIAARALGLPFFYEVRGFWEITRISREPAWEQTEEFRQAVARERAVAKAADRVFTLNRFMREELVRRGVEASRIDLAPNGYGALPDLSRPPRLSRADAGCDTRYVVGYVGSFNDYEGLDDLVRACAQLRQQGVDVSLLLVGSSHAQGLAGEGLLCPVSQRLQQLAGELGFAEFLALPGRVAPEALADYYALIDLVVIPRRPLPVCELVSPIKPLEAMAFGKPLLVAGLKPIAEFKNGAGALTFRKADVFDLSEQIYQLLSDGPQRQRMGKQARVWIDKERQFWKPVEPITAMVRRHSRSGPMRERSRLHHSQQLPLIAPLIPEDLSIRGWPPLEDNGKIRMMSIFDEFSRECFSPHANLIEPRPDNCLSLVERDKPKLLFVESAWRGNKSTWQYRVAKYNNPPGKELSSLIADCQRRQIPTIFWNKEDPVHFENFIDTAKLFDFIFTTAEEVIPHYQQHSQAEVHALPFAAEAGLHNPIGSTNRNDRVCFAGSFYANRFKDRRDDQLMLLDAASNFRLDIFDRNAGSSIAKDFLFPERFNTFIRGKLPYAEMNKAYRQYRVFLNVNSVIDSKTMFSRRVFELLACGTPIVSTVSAGIESMFGNDLVWMVKNQSEAREAIDTLLNDQREWRRRSLQGIRAIFTQHTFAHRFDEVLRIVGLNNQNHSDRRILLVAEVATQADVDRLIEMQLRQKLVYAKTKLLLIPKNNGIRVDNQKISLLIVAGVFQTILQKEIEKWKATHIAFLDSLATYGPFFLQDMLNAFSYSAAQLVGKPNTLVDTFTYSSDIAIGSLIMKADFVKLIDNKLIDNKVNSLAEWSQHIQKQTSLGDIFLTDAANFMDAVSVNNSSSQYIEV